MTNNDEFFMKEAIKEAEIALKEGNRPIGCVVVLNNKIIARSHNKVYSTEDRMAHAEMLALKDCHKILRNHKNEATLYTTYEPCPMCFGAIILNKIGKVVAGIDLDNSGAMFFKEHLPTLFKQDKFNVDFTTGVLAHKCHDVFIQGEPTKDLIKEGLLKINNKLPL